MSTKANNHPLIRDLRQLIKKHNLSGVVMLGLDREFETIAASAGHDVKTCNALGPILSDPNVDLLFIEILGAVATRSAKQPEPFLPLFGEAAE